ncbi:MAG TPA: alpha/beta hydrolase [Clostridiales bacterium]|nr:alpha/beta hydrolase [Clostridiales bacterium]
MEYRHFIFRDSQGNRFEYYTYGPENGYPVLYMHGAVPMPFSKSLLAIVQKHNLYLITILRPGYGSSSRLNHRSVYGYTLKLEEFISHLQLKRFDVLGLSAGSPYCYALAAAYPQLVDGVNICAGIPLVNNKEIYRMNARQERFLFFLSRHLPPYVIGKYGVKAIEAGERKKGWKDTEDGESMDSIFQKYVYPNWYGLGQSTNLQYKNWGFAASLLQKKIYIYHSRDDEMIPFEIALKSSRLLKSCELFEYEKEEHSSERLLKNAIINIAGRL